MARAQVCRFYDDGTTTTALRRPIKRLPEYQSSAGLFYSGKARRPSSPSAPTLQIPRNALIQALFVLSALIIILITNVATSPSKSSSTSKSSSSNPASSTLSAGVNILNDFATRAIGSTTTTSSSSSSSSTANSNNNNNNNNVQQQKSEQSTSKVPLNVAPSAVKKGVSLAAVCMGRHETLKKTVPAWLAVENVDEIIVVDWSSDPPLAPAIRAIDTQHRIKIIRVDGEEKWVLSRAYNLAVNATTRTHVIRTDCDYHIDTKFVSAHAADTEGKHYYAGNYNLARNENEVHLNGAVYIKRADFLSVGGYDERIQTYGWDDEDLYNRLGSAGLTKRNISYDHVAHVAHGNAGRAQAGVKFAMVEIDLNSILLNNLGKPWNKNLAVKNKYTTTANADNVVTITAASRTKSLRELVSQEDYDKAWAEALGRRLHDTYGVPWDIISSFNTNDVKELLLRRLMKRLENREKTKRAELDAAGMKDQIVDINSLAVPRVLVCHCMHGLGNRLRALASCMSFAKETARELVIVWEPDSHIEAKFTDMFRSPMVILEKWPVQWPFKGLEQWDSAWANFKYHNYMEMEGEGALKGEKIIDLTKKHMYYKGAYIMEVENYDLTNWDKDNNMLRSLEPVDSIAKMLNDMQATHGLGVSEDIVALHVRNRTLEKDIKNVDFVKEYGDEATRTMDMWRHKSGVHNFMKLMDMLLKEKPNLKFFVATDTYQVIDTLRQRYGNERILSFPRACDERDGECVKYALADLYALARCKTLYGSNWSSFTEVAMRLGGVKAKLAGEDFGV